MTLTCLPINASAGSPSYSALQTRQATSSGIANGSARTLGTVSGWALGRTPGTLTATSTTWTVGAFACVVDAAFTTTQAPYEIANDANLTGSVTAANASNPRIDILYLQVSDTDIDGSGLRAAAVNYLAGTAASSPVAPALPARSFLVATISVPTSGGGSPTITLNPSYTASAGGIRPAGSSANYPTSPVTGDRVDDLTLGYGLRWNGAAWVGTDPSPFVTFTPTWGGITLGTPAVNSGQYSLIGKSLFVRYMIGFGSTTGITTGVTVALPSGFTSANDFEQNILLKIGFAGGGSLYTGWANIQPNTTTLSLYEPASSSSTLLAQVGSYGQTFGSGSNLVVQGILRVA